MNPRGSISDPRGVRPRPLKGVTHDPRYKTTRYIQRRPRERKPTRLRPCNRTTNARPLEPQTRCERLRGAAAPRRWAAPTSPPGPPPHRVAARCPACHALRSGGGQSLVYAQHPCICTAAPLPPRSSLRSSPLRLRLRPLRGSLRGIRSAHPTLRLTASALRLGHAPATGDRRYSSASGARSAINTLWRPIAFRSGGSRSPPRSTRAVVGSAGVNACAPFSAYARRDAGLRPSRLPAAQNFRQTTRPIRDNSAAVDLPALHPASSVRCALEMFAARCANTSPRWSSLRASRSNEPRPPHPGVVHRDRFSPGEPAHRIPASFPCLKPPRIELPWPEHPEASLAINPPNPLFQRRLTSAQIKAPFCTKNRVGLPISEREEEDNSPHASPDPSYPHYNSFGFCLHERQPSKLNVDGSSPFTRFFLE